jgi:succinyl-diaminopimelate desuccinylase
MIFGDKILKYKDELLADLNTLIGFESVANEKPEECQNAMDFMLKRAKDFGLVGEQVTSESMHIQLGDKGKLCGILCRQAIIGAYSPTSSPKKTADFTAEELQTIKALRSLHFIV